MNDAFDPKNDGFFIEVDKINNIAHARQHRHFKGPIYAVETEFNDKHQ